MHFTSNLLRKNWLLFFILLLVWFSLNIIQSIFTEIGNDEAYYWVYSQHLAWGYFDHPPMLAFLINLGSLIFDGELGVRLFTVVSQVFFLAICYKVANVAVNRISIITFFIVSFSIIMLQAYGFVATPDGVMLLFSLVFLLAYKNYLKKESVANVLFLSLSMALLIYSKYHGILIIGFVVLSNFRLLTKLSFYISGILTLILLLPHIYWQYANGFPTFAFHLVQRSSNFDINNLLEFLANQLVVFNPLTLGAFVYVVYKRKFADLFERALLFIIFGFLVFFALSSIKGYVNPHWTVAISSAIIILILREAMVNARLQRFIFVWLAPSLVLMIMLRIFLIFNILPISTEWHGHKKYMKALGVVADKNPVIFFNRFQEPSKYIFYTHNPAHAINGVMYRNTQFDIWNFDEKFIGDTVLLLTGPSHPKAEKATSNGYDFYLLKIENYQPYKKLKVDFDTSRIVFKTGDSITMPVSIYNPYTFQFNFTHPSMPIQLELVISNQHKVFHTIDTKYTLPKTQLNPFETIHGYVQFVIPEKFKGDYKLWVCPVAPDFTHTTVVPNVHINIQ